MVEGINIHDFDDIPRREAVLKLAQDHSDHGARVQEFEPALIQSLRDTPTNAPVLEIGNRDGGSALWIMWNLYEEAEQRKLITVDINAQPTLIAEWATKFGLPTVEHHSMSQENFIKGLLLLPKSPIPTSSCYGFVYLDADHGELTVPRDMKILANYVCKGGIIAVDDVEGWPELPVIDGMERIEFKVDEGNQVHAVHGHHVAFWVKK